MSATCQVLYRYSLYHVNHSIASQGRNYPILKMRKPRLREFSKLPEVTQVVTGRVGLKPRSIKSTHHAISTAPSCSYIPVRLHCVCQALAMHQTLCPMLYFQPGN